jgi:hypothetical protein
VEVTSTWQVVVDPLQRRQLQPYHAPAASFPIARPAFETLYGSTLPSNDLAKGDEHTLNTPIGDMTDMIAGRLLYEVIQRKIDKMTERGNDDEPISVMMKRMAQELPLRGMIMMNSEKLTYGIGMLMMINGRALRGMRKLLTEFWQTRDSIRLYPKSYPEVTEVGEIAFCSGKFEETSGVRESWRLGAFARGARLPHSTRFSLSG